MEDYSDRIFALLHRGGMPTTERRTQNKKKQNLRLARQCLKTFFFESNTFKGFKKEDINIDIVLMMIDRFTFGSFGKY